MLRNKDKDTYYNIENNCENDIYNSQNEYDNDINNKKDNKFNENEAMNLNNVTNNFENKIENDFEIGINQPNLREAYFCKFVFMINFLFKKIENLQEYILKLINSSTKYKSINNSSENAYDTLNVFYSFIIEDS